MTHPRTCRVLIFGRGTGAKGHAKEKPRPSGGASVFLTVAQAYQPSAFLTPAAYAWSALAK